MKALQRWLQARFKGPFEDSGDSLEHGNQKDGFSCLVCSANTIAHAVFKDELWTMDRAALEKINWFRTLIKDETVNEPDVPAEGLGQTPEIKSDPPVPSKNHQDSTLESHSLVYMAPAFSAEQKQHIVTPLLANLLNPVMSPGPTPANINIDSCPSTLGKGMTEESTSIEVYVDHSTNSIAYDDSSFYNSSADMHIDDSAGVPNSSTSDFGPSITSDASATNDAIDKKSSTDLPFLNLFRRANTSGPIYHKKRSRSRSRSFESSSSKSDTEPVMKESTSKRPKYGSILGPVGIAKSSVQAKKTRDAAKRGELEINKGREKRWRATMETIDPHVEFFEKNVSAARHFNCGKVIKVKQPYDTTRFSVHANGCKGSKKKSNTSGGMATLFQMASKAKWEVKASHAEKPIEEMPCCGISEVDHKLIPAYLERTAAKGGGSCSVAKIALEKYHKTFSLLAPKQKKVVDDIQVHEQQWRNDHAKLRVFSTRCKRSVHIRSNSPSPCAECQSLLHNNQFRIVLKKPTPKKENYKFVNRKFQDPILGKLYARTKGLQDLIESAVCHCL
jgi:hypothetical protein